MIAVGSYYVYYVENRMSNQHEEKFRTMGSIATVFEGRLQSLSTVIKNTPYLRYEDIRSDFTRCMKDPYCSESIWYWRHLKHSKKYYKTSDLDAALKIPPANFTEKNIIKIRNQISDEHCGPQEKLEHDLLLLIDESSNGTADKIIQFKDDLLQQLDSESTGVVLKLEADDAECTARASVKRRLEALKKYTLENFDWLTKSNQPGTWIKYDLHGDNDLLATSVFPALPDDQVTETPVYHEIKVRTSFEELLPENIAPEGSFNKILLLDQEQGVLYSSGNPLPKMSAVQSLAEPVKPF